MDKICILGLACRAKVGVPDRERRRRQKVLIDLTLELDLRRAGAGDSVKDTADYWAVERAARRAAEGAAFRLVERLAQRVAEAVLRAERKVRAVTVAVHKKPAVMAKTREVAMEIRRTRAAWRGGRS